MGKYKKGQSGNPQGRPRGSLNKSTREIKEVIREDVDLQRIVRRLQKKALAGSETAARILFEFGWGKPRQEAELSLRYATVNLISAVRRDPPEEEKKERKALGQGEGKT